MRVFHCDHCEHLLFFENVTCVRCWRALAFLPDAMAICSLDHVGGENWRSPGAEGRFYRLCRNYTQHDVCNWAVPAEDPHELCSSCRLTRGIPDLSKPGNKQAWYKLEVAKRRLVYSLLSLGLPTMNRIDDPEHGLAYEFREDPDDPSLPRVMTGHASGVITINMAEADDAERERRRLAMHEPYRTLLGHFRHEVGHYYWDRLVAESGRLEACRAIFGDEREDYAQALKRHYDNGPPMDWVERYVSSYASSHAWEDWAETFAHYLHMSDTLETAAATGMSLRPRRPDDPTLTAKPPEVVLNRFDRMINDWFPLTYVLNSLNRGLGVGDAYPFVLPTPAIEKLRFVHETVAAAPG